MGILLPELPRNTAFYFYYTKTKIVSGNPPKNPSSHLMSQQPQNQNPLPPLPFHHQSLEPTRKERKKHKVHEPPRTCPPCTTRTRASHTPPHLLSLKHRSHPPPATPRHCLCAGHIVSVGTINAGHSFFFVRFLCLFQGERAWDC